MSPKTTEMASVADMAPAPATLDPAEAAEDAKINAWFQKHFHGHGAAMTVELYNRLYEARNEIYRDAQAL